MSRENRAKDPYDIGSEVDLVDLFRVVARNIKLSIRTHVPASVVVYNPATQKAVVQVQHLPVVRVTDPARLPKLMQSIKGVPPDADATLAPLQLIDIPVVWPRTNMGYITFPLSAGDTGELHISDRSLEAWISKGVPTDPTLAFTHALKDSVFHPGLHSDMNPIIPPTDLTGTVIDGSLVKIGAMAVEAIAKADTLIAVIDAAWAAATPTPNDGGAALKATWLAAWTPLKNTIKATKGRVL